MSKHTRRQTPASRDNRRATLAAKRAEWSAWPQGEYQLGVGAYTTNETTAPRRKRTRHPLGFTGGNT